MIAARRGFGFPAPPVSKLNPRYRRGFFRHLTRARRCPISWRKSFLDEDTPNMMLRISCPCGHVGLTVAEHLPAELVCSAAAPRATSRPTRAGRSRPRRGSRSTSPASARGRGPPGALGAPADAPISLITPVASAEPLRRSVARVPGAGIHLPRAGASSPATTPRAASPGHHHRRGKVCATGATTFPDRRRGGQRPDSLDPGQVHNTLDFQTSAARRSRLRRLPVQGCAGAAPRAL